MYSDLSFFSIFSQTINFFKNKCIPIIIYSVFLATLYYFLTEYFWSEQHISKLEYLISTRNMSQLLSGLIPIVLVFGLLSLINTSINILIVYILSANTQLNTNLLLSHFLSNLLKLLGFNIIYFLLFLFIGFIFSLLIGLIAAMIPTLGSLLTLMLLLGFVIFIITTFGFFSASLVAPSTKSFFQLFSESNQLTKQHWKVAIFMVIIYIIIGTILNYIGSQITSTLIMGIILASLSNILAIFMICFFYRLYQFIQQDDLTSTDVSSQKNNSNDFIF